jgi:hypothetical protein
MPLSLRCDHVLTFAVSVCLFRSPVDQGKLLEEVVNKKRRKTTTDRNCVQVILDARD